LHILFQVEVKIFEYLARLEKKSL